ncbi:hypothetical protein Lqui_0911 [Legionella quinlivanii]|uniref:YecA family protein n=1 Tax=Legionella quinlivanii TaxID=45073 RepID=A0A0W0Y6B6_9GAMM|nr:YecA family protein [Legionella quinlivanii]KTD52067.1 hypothetical protein Lqui_0911 [Legionella quinlivanii]MCW8452331.1 UPF0149 family protein [Legionella quinlivanii]SEF89139.1 hypothetical protein SAMN02746093_01374 [Legionella quinlivanii DSM 21216]STY12437.1 Putative conserved exported protein precursor [Legionella quinlivanii]
MSNEFTHLRLPAYQTFDEKVSVLNLPISSSELHGVLCGYLCAGAISEGETYVRALMIDYRKNEETKLAAMAMFDVYSVSHHQINNMDFDFQLLLPDEHIPLIDRAKAFSEWCEGFTQGLTMAGIGLMELKEEESQEALQHLQEFAELDYQSLEVDEDDEKALMEVSEYARMAVLRLHGDLNKNQSNRGTSTSTH